MLLVSRDVVDVSIGHAWSHHALLFAFISVAFGSFLFVWCLVQDKVAAAFTMMGVFGIVGVAVLAQCLASDWLARGEDVIIDVCKCAPRCISHPRLAESRVLLQQEVYSDSAAHCSVVHEHDGTGAGRSGAALHMPGSTSVHGTCVPWM